MKNKVWHRTISMLLSTVMILSMCTVGTANVSAGEFLGIPNMPGSSILNFIGGRIYNEFTSYCVSNDVPFLGDAFYFALYGPAQRSAMKTSITVQEINATINEIKKDVSTTLEILEEIKNTVTVGFAKTDYESKLIKLQNIENKYTDTWNNYYDASIYSQQAQLLKEEMNSKAEAGTLTELEKINYESDIYSLEKNADIATKSFILNYQEDIMGLQSNVITVETPAQYVKSIHFDREMSEANAAIEEYLLACETLLRASYDFEHEITENMMRAYEYCIKIETQMYSVHEAYASVNAVDNFKKNNPSKIDEIPKMDELLDFSKERESILSYLYNQITVCNLDNLMVRQDFFDKKQKEYEKITSKKIFAIGEEYNPPIVETTTQIGGKTVPCYKVRDNKSLDYLLITQQAETYSSTTESWKNGIGTTVYRPTVVLNQKYTDDGNFKMISSLSEIPSLNTTNNLLSHFRTSEGFDKIDQGIDGILLDTAVYQKTGIWNVSISGVGKYNSGKPNEYVSTYSSKDLKSKTTDTYIRIYRELNKDRYFDNKTNTWCVNDINDLPSIIAIHNGQTLDMSKLTATPASLTIIVSGEAKIIGNPNTTFSNTNIIINTDKQLTIKDLNTKCSRYSTAIEVKSNNSKIKFEGNNTFNGNGGTPNENTYCEYDYGYNPVGTSQGMLIDKNASVTITGKKATFNGSCGGAGICTLGNLTIKDATVTANGSQQEIQMYYINGNGRYYIPVSSIGSGIGGSIGYVCSLDANGQTYTSYGKINIENSNVTANGVDSNTDDNSYSQDIGGFTYVSNIFPGVKKEHYQYNTIRFSGGNISNSTLNLKNSRFDSSFVMANNIYNNDTYTITTVTAGTDGVTNDGISIKIYGSHDTTDWIKLSSLGDSKGTESATASSVFVGKIDYIDVKINSSSNSWFPEKLTIKSDLGKDEAIFYGGRWIHEKKEYRFYKTDSVFKINIKTGSIDNSGTDYDVNARLVDSNGRTTDWINLSDIHPDSDAFEKGDDSTFYIYTTSSLGKCQYIELESTSLFPLSASDWFIDEITVTQVQGAHKGDSFTVNPDQWDVNDHIMTFGREAGKVGTFDFEIKTSKATGAGTDASIILQLIGTKGSTNAVIYIDDYVESYTPGNNFEKNDKDKFRITFDLNEKGLGDIKGIYIVNNGDYFGPDWKVDYINVTEILPDGSKGNTYHFNIYDWIDAGERFTKYL